MELGELRSFRDDRMLNRSLPTHIYKTLESIGARLEKIDVQQLEVDQLKVRLHGRLTSLEPPIAFTIDFDGYIL